MTGVQTCALPILTWISFNSKVCSEIFLPLVFVFISERFRHPLAEPVRGRRETLFHGVNKLREICQAKLSNPAQDIEVSNRMWNRRAKEVSRLSARADGDGYFSFFKSSAGDLNGLSVLDSGCGAGR